MVRKSEIGVSIDPEALKRYRAVAKPLEATRVQIAAGDFVPPEKEVDDYLKREVQQTRLDVAQGRRSTKMLLGLERQVGLTRDILSIEFFEAGLVAARSIGRVSVGGGVERGTGVLVGRDLLLTNNHVLPSPQRAAVAEFDLDFEENRFGTAKAPRHFWLEPDRFFCTHQQLDFTIVAVTAADDTGRPLADSGWHPLIQQQGKIRLGDPVNLVHHPLGSTKSVTLHNSNLLHISDDGELSDYLWYSSDTEPGSSGAPVFSNRWEVVALHRRSIPKKKGRGYAAVDGGTLSEAELEANPSRAVWIANEGVRVSRLVAAFREAEFGKPAQARLRDEVIALWDRTNAGQIGRESVTARAPDPTAAATPRVERRGGRVTIEIDLD
jgi:endonuclease G